MVNKRFLLLAGAALMMSPHVITSPTDAISNPQQTMFAYDSISYRYTGRYRTHPGTGRRIGRGAYIVRNQRQKRKRWRQSPHKRPVSNVH